MTSRRPYDHVSENQQIATEIKTHIMHICKTYIRNGLVLTALMNLHALFHLLKKKKTIILLITVPGTVHAEHGANDLVERNSTAVLVRVVSERC